ncbi:hypothetical protein [Geminisphaera colitermitum]|uniref:hypothetical protein n=1 Tax=Geminisphaera colitermitum TaxID=1148786 RepID=UPI0001965043|nr:hypothetical protein [Geminisphaera colitermitum]
MTRVTNAIRQKYNAALTQLAANIVYVHGYPTSRWRVSRHLARMRPHEGLLYA